MSILRKIVMLLCLCVMSISHVSIAFASHDHREAFIQARETLLSKPYEFELRYINQRSNVANGQVKGIVDPITQSAQLTLQFKVKQDGHYVDYQTTLYVYNNFDSMYLDLNSMLLGLNESSRHQRLWLSRLTQLKENGAAYIQIPPTEIQRHTQTPLSESLITDWHTAALLNSDTLTLTEDAAQISLEGQLTQIPESLLTGRKLLNLLVEVQALYDAQHQFHVDVKADIRNQSKGLDFAVKVKGEPLTNMTWVELLEAYINGKALSDRVFEAKESRITTKLTAFKLSYNKETQTLTQHHQGLYDSMRLNLQNESSATFKTFEFETIYTAKPTTQRIPSEHELDAVSLEVYNTQLNQK